ncbi:hypothetical protein [Pseudonocardia dioxanivorans]|uniref:hypothetical protein n=1 Tax=Pseudonocardia dioxanivorans TaxID=240495 RepID=UPI001042D697|nr:hypothetical protein [Pseudonocardia dioxanivorans]
MVHPIVRRAVYDAIPTAERSLLHSTAARQLAKAGVAAESVAPHALAGEPWGDGAVVDLLRRAAARSLDRGCSTCSPGTRPASASEAARPVVEWTNVFMQPPPPHAQDLLGAAARHQQVADAFIDNFDDPAAMWHVLSDPAHTAEWLDRLGARTPVG